MLCTGIADNRPWGRRLEMGLERPPTVGMAIRKRTDARVVGKEVRFKSTRSGKQVCANVVLPTPGSPRTKMIVASGSWIWRQW